VGRWAVWERATQQEKGVSRKTLNDKVYLFNWDFKIDETFLKPSCLSNAAFSRYIFAKES